MHLEWQQLHEIVQATEHPFRKHLCRNQLQGPDGQVKKASAAAAKTISILAVKVQTTDLRKDFFGTFETALGMLYSKVPPLQEGEGHTGASPVDSMVRGREG